MTKLHISCSPKRFASVNGLKSESITSTFIRASQDNSHAQKLQKDKSYLTFTTPISLQNHC